MSRSGYDDYDADNWSLIRWRGAEADGAYCALGAVAARRGLDLAALDAAMQNEYRDVVAQMLGIPDALAGEIMFENDWIEDERYESYEVVGPLRPYESRVRSRRVYDHTAPSRRWKQMRDWAARNLQGDPRGEA